METTQHTGFHIPSLDGIRACSILLVFIAHSGLQHLVPGSYGVTVFFFLSGYLITTLLIREFEKKRTISIGSFYVRRTLRIFPPMYLVLGAALIVAAFNLIPDNRFTGTSVFSLAAFWSNYYTPQSGWQLPAGTTAFWSLAIEEHYYLLFPVTFLLLRKRLSNQSTAVVLIALCAAALIWRCVLVFQLGADHDRVYYASDARFDNILYGSVFALLWNPALGKTWNRPHWQLMALVIACAALVIFTFVYRNEDFRNTLRYTIQGLTLMPLFYYVITCRDTITHRLLNWKPMVFLGKISYSLYLLHVLVLAVVYENIHIGEFDISLAGKIVPLHMVIKAVLSFALTTFLSWLIFLFVEQPSARLKHRLQKNKNHSSFGSGAGGAADVLSSAGK
ncbi:MAG: peptidoglycan/LPS O-acetylase OafA/YrhL [Verrucomicrobiales bacterium]|jgi:peptidoglycan/LPS O-acetylase OafA/YrhL